MRSKELNQEFENQVEKLMKIGYPQLIGKSGEEFLELVEPLKEQVKHRTTHIIDFEKGYLPFVIVVNSELVATETAMSLVVKDDKQGITKLFPHEPKDFQIIVEEKLPNSFAYLLVDIDRGKENINLPPKEALQLMRSTDRHPLTIDEGIAILMQYPDFLVKNNCFSMLASRHQKDKRVPAIWINNKKQPNLGWCWDGNPHTWLGSASCGERVGSSN